MKKSVLLTSRENFVWSSMQEIIPAIENAWMKSAGAGHRVRVVDVDREPLAKYLRDVMEADNVVLTCFTVKLARLGEFLRREAGVDARYFIYLHNQATIACWPLFKWGLGHQLREDDVFVSSSSWDARTLALTFPKGLVRFHPFSLPDARVDSIKRSSSPIKTFVYSGRVSSQKNLHTLIYAFKLLRERSPSGSSARLVIFGGEDGLGSPNMGFKDEGYGAFLRSIVKRLGLEDVVEFTGRLEREELHRRLREPHVLVSASLHSDENFGMSALRSLCMGAPAVLSKWGGHGDFKKYFRERVELVEVNGSERGPWVDPVSFARAMAKSSRKAIRGSRIPRVYRPDSMSVEIRKWIAEPRSRRVVSLEPSPFAKEVFAGLDGDTKIFTSYSDPKSHAFFSSYGMRRPRRRRVATSLSLVPWVRNKGSKVVIEDPHRGAWTVNSRGPATMKTLVAAGLAHRSWWPVRRP